MSPDEPMIPDARHPDDVIVPFDDERLDAELAAIDTELRRASERLRRRHARDGRARPSSGFAGSLRARLLAEAALPLPVAAPPSPAPVAVAEQPAPVRPRIARRTPTVLPAPRWSVLGIAAVILVAVLGLGAERLFSVPAPARVTAASGVTVERDGATLALASGADLRAGDTIRVAPGGAASLALGESTLRLDAGAAVRLDTLTATVAVEQLAGRAWHRVSLADGGAYRVTTGDLTWTAVGTAFDLERSGGTVRLLTVEHDVELVGPGVRLRIPEGREAVVGIDGDRPDVSVEDAETASAATDPWVVANARLDRAAGFGTGWLTTAVLAPTTRPSTPPPAATATPEASPGASASPPAVTPAASAAPTATPAPTPTSTPRPTGTPTPTPRPTGTPKPTATPAPATPTPAPELLALGMSTASCGGATFLDWSGYPGDTFHHWTVLRAPAPFDVPASYPPPAGVTALEASYAKDPSVSSFADTTLAAGTTAYYRVVAFDATDRAIAASPAKAVTGKPVASLGTFGAAPAPGGADTAWAAYGGPAACFTYYKISWSATNPNPSYVGDHDGALPVGEQGATGQYVALAPGTWWIRVEAILVTDTGKHVVGKSTVAQVTVAP